MGYFPRTFPDTFPIEGGSWVGELVTYIQGVNYTYDFVATYNSGSSNVEYKIRESTGSEVISYRQASVGSNSIDVTGSVSDDFRIIFRLSGDPDLGSDYTPIVSDLSLNTIGGVLQTKNLGSDVKLSNTNLNAVQYIPSGSYTNLANGSFSNDGGSTWYGVNPNENFNLPSAGSEIFFKVSDNTGSLVLNRIKFFITQEDF